MHDLRTGGEAYPRTHFRFRARAGLFMALCVLFVEARHLRQRSKALGELCVGGDEIAHFAVVELLIGDHVEVAGAGQTEDDGLGLAGLAALNGLVDGDADGVAGLRRGQDALDARELLGRLEHLCLLDGAGLHVAVVIQLRDDGAHAVVAQAAGVVRRGDEAAAERVHLGQRADLAGVAEVVGEPAAREARAGSGLDGDEPIVALAAQFLTHEWGDEATEVAAAAGAADDDVRHDAVFVERRFRLQTDDRLVQQHLIEHAAEHVAVAGSRGGDLDGLADRAAERAGRAGVLGEDAPADLRLRGRARRHGRAVGAHHLAAEALPYPTLRHAYWSAELPKMDCRALDEPLQQLEQMLCGKEAEVRRLCEEYNLYADLTVRVFAASNDLPELVLPDGSVAFWASVGAAVSFDFYLD